MTTPPPASSLADVVDQIASALVPTTPTRGSVGLEVEWIVVDREHPTRPVPGDEVLAAAAGPLPGGGTVGVEPGGQLECTTPRHPDPSSALAASAEDERTLRRRLATAGLAMLAVGVDPFRAPVRSLDLPRYRAMEAAFDARGPEGREMMCSTASVQVNLDLGADPLDTWRRVGTFAPVVAAAFANSPGVGPDGRHLASVRSAVWAAIDPSRTRPVPTGSVDDWVDYALDADVLYVRDGGEARPPDPPMSLREWTTGRHPRDGAGRERRPTADDVAEHLTTLFPPVRPRGWIECRFFDALDADEREVAVLVVAALAGAGTPADAVARACAPVAGRPDPWAAVRFGTADPDTREAAERCAALAADVLDDEVRDAGAVVRSWADRRRAQGWRPPTPDLQSIHRTEQEIP